MRYLTLALILFSTLACALGCGNFDGWVRALYWTPSTAPSNYLQVNTTISSNLTFFEGSLASFDHNWGVELGGGLSRCGGSGLQLRGLWVCNSRSFFKRIQPLPDQVTNTVTLPEFAEHLDDALGFTSTQIRSQYWTVRLTLDQNFYFQSRFFLGSSVGGRYVNLSQFLSTNGEFFSPATQTQQSKAALSQSYNGGGIEASVSGQWDLGWSLVLSGEVGVSAIVGVSKTRVNVNTVNANEAIRSFYKQPSLTKIAPGLDVSLGLAFSKCIRDVRWNSSVGYAIQHYFSVFQKPQFHFNDPFAYVSAGYAGPYLSFGAQF